MLRRAIRSVLDQTYSNLVVRVVNDDPADLMVANILKEFDDPRVDLFLPVQKRGATRNFNLVFKETEAAYVSLLEDDNWWESTFIFDMLHILREHPKDTIVVGNETIWQEQLDGSWLNTERTIWEFRGLRSYEYELEAICGHAKLCNSSMLVRIEPRQNFLTPDNIPVDVTEHFRERLLPTKILLNGNPLVNYAETLQTARGQGYLWGQYQMVLIASAFAALSNDKYREDLANLLWANCTDPVSPRAVSLVGAGLVFREARHLLFAARFVALGRAAIWLLRRPERLRVLARTREELATQFDYLIKAPLTVALAERFERGIQA